jgi:hypothetical protein
VATSHDSVIINILLSFFVFKFHFSQCRPVALDPLTCVSYSDSTVLPTSLDRPKSATLQVRFALTKTFLAAKSLNEETYRNVREFFVIVETTNAQQINK